jgi:hypothetical protein
MLFKTNFVIIIKKNIFFTIDWSSERPIANHCDVCKLFIFILTSVTPLAYVQPTLTPAVLVCVTVVVVPIAPAVVFC